MTALYIVGALSVAFGCALVSLPAGLIVGGMLAMGTALLAGEDK